MSDLRARVESELTGVVADLGRLVAIASVSADPDRDADVRASADLVAELLRGTGCDDVRVVDGGGKPAVIARFPAPEGRPTIGLYAHHDVQPTGDLAEWTSDPFTATERDGRLYGRGTADDKGGFAVHLAALRAFGGRPPVGVTLLVEGEEELGSPTLQPTLDAHRELLACDALVVCDSSNWEVGRPALTTSLRGMCQVTVTLRTLDHPLHSGQFGGAAPDALTSMCRLVATLHDDRGNVAVDGLQSYAGPAVDYPEERFRSEAGVLDGVELQGEGSVAERIWYRPAISVIGLDARPVDQASNTLYPHARATLSMRVAPGDDADRALQALLDHLRTHTPHGAELEVTNAESGQPTLLGLDGRYASAAREAFTEAWGVEPVAMGMGGSIPLAQAFADTIPTVTSQEPRPEVVLTAVVDPSSQIHGYDESLDLGDFGKACLAEALLLERLAD